MTLYSFLWRLLPGPVAVKTTLCLAILAGLGLVLWYLVFPVIDDWLFPTDAAIVQP
ncbi:hypothetical protein [Amycolatopsis cihanbeyliensis]|uniref:Uncharacterized protein n=1 Tax=Amycolatopsis cihanbeyliensis TaxID=1128664 RepID=A0A542DBW6_AMYCI|nr:hypothetical protein [Amycolatopsis cihanbeyliensis]TQJ00562.1 hypothetical protein FB471_0193 [Amycolatopsis cihanbeyliensis]